MGALTITADWDDEAEVRVATSDDILGLVTEADTLEMLREKLSDLVPELIEENGLRAGCSRTAPIEIVARQRLAIRAA